MVNLAALLASHRHYANTYQRIHFKELGKELRLKQAFTRKPIVQPEHPSLYLILSEVT